MDYYCSLLGVEESASQEDIKKAYRKLAHLHHPDKKGGDEAKFKKINEAYQVLGNQEKRQQYDQFGQSFDGMDGGAPGGFDFNSFNQGGFDFGNIDLGDLFGMGGRQQRQPINRGKDIKIQLKIKLKDVLETVEKKLNLSKMTICSRRDGGGGEPDTKVKECFSCRGTGWVQQMKRMGPVSFSQQTRCPDCKGQGNIPESPCNVCKGEGRIKEKEDIKIVIPAGVDSNQIIKMKGKGEAGRKGGESGDLYVRILVKEHSRFIRKGDDLYTFIEITFSQASLGSEIEVDMLDKKKLSLKIPQGMQSGKILKISGKGIPRFSGNGRGNMYIELIIKTPKKLSRKQKELLEELKKQGL